MSSIQLRERQAARLTAGKVVLGLSILAVLVFFWHR